MKSGMWHLLVAAGTPLIVTLSSSLLLHRGPFVEQQRALIVTCWLRPIIGQKWLSAGTKWVGIDRLLVAAKLRIYGTPFNPPFAPQRHLLIGIDRLLVAAKLRIHGTLFCG